MKQMYKSFILAVVFALVLTACGGAANNGNSGNNADGGSSSSGGEEVILNIPNYKTGQNVGAKYFLGLVERFNEAYDGQYEIVVEEVPQDSYAEKIKLLYQQNQLPPLIDSMSDKDFIEDVVIAEGKFYDLKPWLDSKPELKSRLIEESIEYVTTEDGKIPTMPMAVIRPIGIFYNKDHFEQAGITQAIGQMSVEEFFQALDQLKEAGITPLALMTGENAWTTMLIGTAILANEPGGAEILNSEEKVYDYTSEPWINTFAKLQTLLREYTTDNAIGAAYADAANNFMNERTAMIANGTWMIGDFSDTTKAVEGFEQKVGASLYPGGVAIASAKDYLWWIPEGLPEDQLQGALAFLEFMHSPEELERYMIAEGGNAPNVETSDEFESQLDPILAEFNQSVNNDLKTMVQSFETIWPSAIPNEFGKYLPLLVDGSLTPEQFAQELTNKAQQFK